MNQKTSWRAGVFLTVQSITEDPVKAFEQAGPAPAWINKLEFLAADPQSGRITDAKIGLGRTHALCVVVNVFALAVLWEMTRPAGVSIVTNSNHKKRPRVYAKMSFADEPGHLVSIRRILYDAAARQATKARWDEQGHEDYSPESTRLEPDGHPQGRSRAIAMWHVETAARRHAPELQAFLMNVWALFDAVDAIAQPAKELDAED